MPIPSADPSVPGRLRLPVTIDAGTDTAGFLIFHPEDLAHRWSDDLGWAYGDEFAVEARAGRILGWETGSDGSWGIRLTDRPGELPLVPGRRADYLLEVRHGWVLVDDNSYLPSKDSNDFESEESERLSLANGRYRVQVSQTDAVPGDGVPEYEVLFVPIGDTETVEAATTIISLRPSYDTLGKIVNDWTAHPDDPVVSAYERWLIALDSGESVTYLPSAGEDGAPADPPGSPRRAQDPPTSADSVDELRALIADVGARGLLETGRRNLILAGRLLTYPGLSGWLRQYLPLTDDETEQLDSLPRQARFDALLARLRELAATPLPPASTLSEAEQRLLRPVPALDPVELPTEPVIIFRDPPRVSLPGAVLQLSVPTEFAASAADTTHVGLITTTGVVPTARPYGYPGTLAVVRGWDPATSILTAEVLAHTRCHDRSVADRPVSVAEIGFGGGHSAVPLSAEPAELKALITTAAGRDPDFAAGPVDSVPADRVDELQTVPGIAEWLLRALPMRPELRLELYAAAPEIAGTELLAQLRALADPTAVTELEADLLTVRPWLTALPPGPLHIATGAAHLPGSESVLRDRTARWAPYELFSPSGQDGDLATLNELVTAPIPGPPGHFEHRRRHLGLVRIVRTYVGETGVIGLAAALPPRPHEDVEDIVEPAAVAAFVADRLQPGSGLESPTSWDAPRLHSARAVSAWLLRHLNLEPKTRLTLAATPPRERLQVLLDHVDAHAQPGHRITRAARPADFPGYQALVDSQPAPARSEVPLEPAIVYANEDATYVLGERMDTQPPAAAWPVVSRHWHAAWAGRAADGSAALLVRTVGSNTETKAIKHEVIGVVRLSEVTRRSDGAWQARMEGVPLGLAGDLDGVIDRDELRELLHRAADRDPHVVTGWRRPQMRAPQDVADLSFSAVGEDLLRRLPMPLSTRVEVMISPERERFQTLINQLREIADGAPPQPELAQRMDRPLIDLPPHAVPVLASDIWLTPGNVSTITASGFIADKSLAAGWLAFTSDLTLGRAAMATRPVRRSDAADADGWYRLTTDQIRPAIVRAVVPGEAGRSLVELAAAPSAAEALGRGLPEAQEERELLTTHLELLGRAYARNALVVGTASGTAYRLWQAGRFTSLRALLSWQIGQLGFGAQTVLDLQAIAWPDRLRALTLVLQGVADGLPLADARAQATEVAAAALRSTA